MNPLLIAVGLLGDRELTDELLLKITGALKFVGVSNKDADDTRKQLEAIYGVTF